MLEVCFVVCPGWCRSAEHIHMGCPRKSAADWNAGILSARLGGALIITIHKGQSCRLAGFTHHSVWKI